MKRINLFTIPVLIIVLFLISKPGYTQHTVITDDESYNGDNSALLDVKSTDKGVLIPRLTTAQRLAISNPATGLLVFDSNINAFFFFNGSAWQDLSSQAQYQAGSGINISGNVISNTAPDEIVTVSGGGATTVTGSYPSFSITSTDNQTLNINGNSLSISGGNNITLPSSNLWNTNGNHIFYNSGNVGIGTNNPTRMLEIGADASAHDTIPLFEVKNREGQPVFRVFPNGVEVIVDEEVKGSNNLGGFAVSGRSAQKGESEYLIVSPDSIRIYIDNQPTKAGNNLGGFAVSGRSANKLAGEDYLQVTPTKTHVFVDEEISGNNLGGFAVSGRSADKYTIEDILVSTFDSTRIYVNQPAKNNLGGFAVSGRSAQKGINNFMDLTPENYFIGHDAGSSITTGLYNSFMGYNAGMHTTIGGSNIFLGYKSGMQNTTGDWNVFIGNESGTNNQTGQRNVFIGDEAGYSNTTGVANVFMGTHAGHASASSGGNVYIGDQSGVLAEGSWNVFVGAQTGGYSTTGGDNVFLGAVAGQQNTTGYGNTYVGKNAGLNLNGTYNVALGHGANAGVYGQPNSGSNNVSLGAFAGYKNTDGSNNVFIGHHAGKDESGDYKLIINTMEYSPDPPLIYGEFDNQNLIFNVANGRATINNLLHLEPRTNAPTSPQEGDIYYDATDQALRLYSAGSWKTIQAL